MDNDSVPQADSGPQLTIAPDGVEIYHALRRGKQFVTLHYRKDKPVQLSTVQGWIGAVLDDIARADLLVHGGIKMTINPSLTTPPTSASSYTASAKMEVRPLQPVDEEEDGGAWAEAIRVQLSRPR